MDHREQRTDTAAPTRSSPSIEPAKRYSEREAAEILGVSRATLYELRKRGEIQYMPWLRRSIRYPGKYLISYIDRCERAGRAKMGTAS